MVQKIRPGTEVVAGARRLRAAERFLSADEQSLRATQNERLRRTIHAALSTSPYRRLYGSADWTGGLDDLVALPFVDRDYLASFPREERMACDPKPLVGFSSSGTSGRPLRTGWSRDEEAGQATLMARQWRAQGLRVARDPFIVSFSSQRYVSRLQVGERTVEMSIPNSAPALAVAIRRARPRMLAGDPSLLLEVAEILEQYPAEALITGGEFLDPQTRALLEVAFGVRPLDLYGSAEGGWIAWECPSGAGYHINADAVIVEVVDAAGRPVPEGSNGEVVITNLWNLTCPIVRYRTGDIGALLARSCDCGVTLPLMGQVEGRENDWITAPDGRRVSPMRVLLFPVPGFRADPHVRRYRIVQRAVDDFLIQVQWRYGRQGNLVEWIAPFYAEILGAAVNVEVEDVDSMPRSPSGKFRVVESHIAHLAS